MAAISPSSLSRTTGPTRASSRRGRPAVKARTSARTQPLTRAEGEPAARHAPGVNRGAAAEEERRRAGPRPARRPLTPSRSPRASPPRLTARRACAARLAHCPSGRGAGLPRRRSLLTHAQLGPTWRRRSAARGPRWRPGAPHAGSGPPPPPPPSGAAGRGTGGCRWSGSSEGSAPRPAPPPAASCSRAPGPSTRVSGEGTPGRGCRGCGLPAASRPLCSALLSRRDEARSRRLLPQQRGPRQGGLLRGAGGAALRQPEGDQEGVLPGTARRAVRRSDGILSSPNDSVMPSAEPCPMCCPCPVGCATVILSLILFFLVQLAKKYHPDTNKDDPKAKEKFAQLAEAYEVTCSILPS